MPSSTVLEPLKFDSVNSPVVVTAAYTTSTTFPMHCAVSGNNEPTPVPRHPPGGVHKSVSIAIALGTHSVHAKSGSAFFHTESDVKVVSGALPVQVNNVEWLEAKGKSKKRLAIATRTLSGECNAGANPPAEFVLCRVYEVNVQLHTRGLIMTPVTAPIILVGGKRTWEAEVEFPMNTGDINLQYVARISAHDSEGMNVGNTSKYLPKS